MLTESTIISYLGSPAFNEDPFPAYRFFLDHPGWPSPSGYRVIARFDDVLGILRDPDTFGQPGRVDGNFHTADPPEHTRLRKLVSRAFTFRATDPAEMQRADAIAAEAAKDTAAFLAEFIRRRLDHFRRSILNEKVVHP